MEAPETHYAVRPDGVNVAYQVLGEGPLNIVWCQGFISHLDLQWTNPATTRFFQRLASFSRLLIFDKAGTGLSDPVAHLPTLEERVEDIRAVMDAAGMTEAALFGESEGGPSSILFAATYPERVRALLLYGTLAKGDDLRDVRAWITEIVDDWGKGRSVDFLVPSMAESRAFRTAMATFERASVSPTMARELIASYQDIDVSDVLPVVSAPTLVLHRTNEVVPIEAGRFIAEQIPEARFVELEGTDHAYFTQNSDAILDEAERFLTGSRRAAEPDRILATVLFTDIVDSTARAAALGDTAWRELLERHDALVRERVEAAGGRVVKSTGDGALAVMSGPARAIHCAEAIVAGAGELGLELRAGLHTGECEAIGDDVGGLAVHIGARVAAKAEPGEVLVSSTVRDLVIGSGLDFADRGEHELKGVPGTWRLSALGGHDQRPAVDGAGEHMKLGDRATVRMARRAPGLLRAIGRRSMRDSA
ncbi:MAG TPA: adenylate/guanylate cyclase domain-containing protein [Thermoleophilaceae bacterium]